MWNPDKAPAGFTAAAVVITIAAVAVVAAAAAAAVAPAEQRVQLAGSLGSCMPPEPLNVQQAPADPCTHVQSVSARLSLC